MIYFLSTFQRLFWPIITDYASIVLSHQCGYASTEKRQRQTLHPNENRKHNGIWTESGNFLRWNWYSGRPVWRSNLLQSDANGTLFAVTETWFKSIINWILRFDLAENWNCILIRLGRFCVGELASVWVCVVHSQSNAKSINSIFGCRIFQPDEWNEIELKRKCFSIENHSIRVFVDPVRQAQTPVTLWRFRSHKNKSFLFSFSVARFLASSSECFRFISLWKRVNDLRSVGITENRLWFRPLKCHLFGLCARLWSVRFSCVGCDNGYSGQWLDDDSPSWTVNTIGDDSSFQQEISLPDGCYYSHRATIKLTQIACDVPSIQLSIIHSTSKRTNLPSLKSPFVRRI